MSGGEAVGILGHRATGTCPAQVAFSSCESHQEQNIVFTFCSHIQLDVTTLYLPPVTNELAFTITFCTIECRSSCQYVVLIGCALWLSYTHSYLQYNALIGGLFFLMSHYRFCYDERLGISLPVLDLDWEEYTAAEREQILLEWEMIRGTIPDRVRHFEELINRKQDELNREEDFSVSCQLNAAIAELASCIQDLHIWYRVNQGFEVTRTHS